MSNLVQTLMKSHLPQQSNKCPSLAQTPTSIGTWSLILRKRSLVGQRTAAHFYQVLRTRLFRMLPHGKVRASEIAHRLGLSRQILARRLSDEGLTFSDVLESLRSDLAERYLTEEDLSISQIAWLLGYQEVSALTHAFKRWTGKTPREARSGAAS